MKNHKITKAVEKSLHQIANGLPVLYDRVLINKAFSGKDLKLTGFTVDDAGKELIDDKIYPVPTPVMNARNHYRRLKKIYESGGQPEVINYITKVKREVVQLENLE